MPRSLWMGIRPKVKLKLHFLLNPIMLAPPSLISQPHAFSPLEHLHQFHRGGSKPPRSRKKKSNLPRRRVWDWLSCDSSSNDPLSGAKLEAARRTLPLAFRCLAGGVASECSETSGVFTTKVGAMLSMDILGSN